MRLPRWFVAAAVPLAFASLATRAQTSTVADRTTEQNRLFDDYYENSLRESPERATAVGDYRFNDKLDDESLAAIARRHDTAHAYLVRLRMIDTAGMPEQDLLSHQLLERTLQNSDQAFALKDFEMPVSQQGGIHISLADLPLSMPFDSVKHYDDYIARLHAIPLAMQQTMEAMRAGEHDGLMPVQFLIAKVPAQCDGILSQNPFLIPLRTFPASFSDAERQRLAAAISTTVQNEVLPAYRTFAAFVKADYLPRGRTTLSIESLPDGKRRYAIAVRRMTTTSYTPEQIHDLGLKEVARITELQTSIAKQQGYPDLASFRVAISKRSALDSTFRRADSERLSQVHRADGAQAAAALQPATKITRNRGSHSRLPGRRLHALPNRHSRRQAPGPCVCRCGRLRAPHARTG